MSTFRKERPHGITIKGAIYEHPTKGTVRIDDADADTLREILELEINSREYDIDLVRKQRDRFMI